MRGSVLNVLVVIFIFSGRWMGAGWLTNLSDFVDDPNRIAHDSDAADVLDRHNVAMPTSFDQLQGACDAAQGRYGLSAFVANRLHHWNWIPYLMGMGGRIFRDPPENLTLVLVTPEAVRSAQRYAELQAKFGPSGVLSFFDGQAMRSQMAGRAFFCTQALTWLAPLAKQDESTVKSNVRYSLMPSGPQGNLPGSNSHGLGIPAGSRCKEAAWEFIKWALSKAMLNRIITEHGYPSVCRRSVITGEAFKQAMTLNGQDVAALYLQVLELGGRSGYMKYRTVPVFPQVGDPINRAIGRIATRQQDAAAAMRQAQQDAVQVLQRAGVTVDGGRGPRECRAAPCCSAVAWNVRVIASLCSASRRRSPCWR